MRQPQLNRALDAVAGGWFSTAFIPGKAAATLSWGNVLYYGGDLHLEVRNLAAAFDVTRFERNTANQLSQNYRTFPQMLTRSDATNNVDLSLLKNFRITEASSLAFAVLLWLDIAVIYLTARTCWGRRRVVPIFDDVLDRAQGEDLNRAVCADESSNLLWARPAGRFRRNRTGIRPSNGEVRVFETIGIRGRLYASIRDRFSVAWSGLRRVGR
jgi:hypothetical protein